MGTFSSLVKSVYVKTATVGAWFRYNDLGGGLFDPASWSTLNADIISELRGTSNANHYVVYSSTLTPWIGFAGTPGIGTLLLFLDWDNVVTDLGTMKASELPSGFRVKTANFKQLGTNASDAGGTTGTDIQRSGANLLSIFPDHGTVSDVVIIDASDPSEPALLILASSYGVRFTSTGALSTLSAVSSLQVSGTYDILLWQVGIATGADAGDFRIFGSGSLFALWSGGALSGDINNIYATAAPYNANTGPDLKGTFGAGSGGGVASIIFSWSDTILGPQSVTVLNTDFDDWTIIYISFLLPGTLPSDTLIEVSVNFNNAPAIPAPAGTGTQFSGSVKLGTIKILTTAASGIYRIVADKTSDTIYIDSPTSDDNIEVAIPYPHIITGFIGG